MNYKKIRKLRLAVKGILSLILSIGIIGICGYIDETIQMSAEEMVNSDLSILQMIISVKSYYKFFNLFKVISFNSPLESSIYLIGYILIGVIFYLFFISEISKSLKEKSTFEIDNKYGSHGTAEWADDLLINDIYKDNDKLGWFFGATEKIPYEVEKTLNAPEYIFHSVNNKTELNMQAIVCGPPGSNKTIGFVLPNLLHLPQAYKYNNEPLPDIICIDPKGELLTLTYKYYEQLGYDIKILDYIDLEIGDTINNLYYLDKERDILSFASNYVKTFMGGNKQAGGETFWQDSATNLLAAMVGYVLQKLPFEKQNMLGVLEVLQSENVRNVDLAKDFFEEEGLEGAPLFCWNNFLAAGQSPETYSSILVTLATNMSLFAFKEVQNLSKDNTCNIKLLGKKISSEKEYLDALKKSQEQEKEYQQVCEKVEDEIIGMANLAIDAIEQLLDVEILDRKNYEDIIGQYSFQIDQEQFSLMELESDGSIKPNSKRMQEIQNRQEDIRQTTQFITQFTKKKEECRQVLNNHTKRLEERKKEVENLKKKPIILYILMADDDPSLQPLVNVTTNTILRQLYTNARQTVDKKLEAPVYFIFEEFNNIGKIPDIELKLGTMRSKRIYPMMIIQSLAQLKDKYEKEWENILSQCDTQIFLGLNDNFSAEYLSTTLGSQTIRVYSGTDNMLGEITEHYQSMQEQFQARKLKELNELRSMDNDNLIIVARGLNPMFLYKCKFKYWENGWIENMRISLEDLKKIGE